MGYLNYLFWRVVFNIKYPASFLARLHKFIFCRGLRLTDREPSISPKVSIVIVTYGALEYIKKCLYSLNKFKPKNAEIIVFDNCSDQLTKKFLAAELAEGRIDKLKLSDLNLFFVKGNNEAVKLASNDSEYLVLLNSDVEIVDRRWFSTLLEITPKHGISAYGEVNYPYPRPDGWCFMVDRVTFQDLGGLDECFQMDWGITEFTARVMDRKIPVQVITNSDLAIVHFGGKSRKSSAMPFNSLSDEQVVKMFSGKRVSFFRLLP